MAFIDGLPRAEPFEQDTPLNARPHSVQNPVDHLPVGLATGYSACY